MPILARIQVITREAAGWPGAVSAVAGATAPRARGLQRASERADGRVGLLGAP